MKLKNKNFLILFLILAFVPLNSFCENIDVVSPKDTLTMSDLNSTLLLLNRYGVEYIEVYDLGSQKINSIYKETINNKVYINRAIYTIIGYAPINGGVILLEGNLIQGHIWPKLNIIEIDDQGNGWLVNEMRFIYGQYGYKLKNPDYCYVLPKKLHKNIVRIDFSNGTDKISISNINSLPKKRVLWSFPAISLEKNSDIQLDYSFQTMSGTSIKLNEINLSKFRSLKISATPVKDMDIYIHAALTNNIPDSLNFSEFKLSRTNIFKDISSELKLEPEFDPIKNNIIYYLDNPILSITIIETINNKRFTTNKEIMLDLQSMNKIYYFESEDELEFITRKFYSPEISCSIKGQKNTIPRPLLWKDVVYVHCQALLETLGYNVTYDSNNYSFTAFKDPQKVYLPLKKVKKKGQNNMIQINDKNHPLEQPPIMLYNYQYYIPASVAKLLGYKVNWDETNFSLTIE